MVESLIFAGALGNLLLGVFIIINNPKAILYRVYFLLSLCAAAWLLVNALTVDEFSWLHTTALLFISRLITPLSLLVSLSLLLFFIVFKKRKIAKLFISATLLSAIVGVFSFTPANVYITGGKLELGSLFPFFIAAVVYTNLLTFYLLLTSSAEERRDSHRRLQLTYLRFGAVAAVVPAIGFGVILPLFSDSPLSNLGPVSSLIFLIFVGMAIVRNQLFDLRLAIARTVGYLATLGALGLLYGGALFLLASQDAFNDQSLAIQRLEYIILALASALLFPWLRRKFARLTDKVFYQDSYDPQIFLDELNKSIVGNIELNRLLSLCSEIITRNLKIERCGFVITNQDTLRVFGNLASNLKPSEIVEAQITNILLKEHVLVSDYLNPEADRLKQILYSRGIAVIVSLNQDQQKRSRELDPVLGYMVLGHKKSGHIFNPQDVRLLSIITNELVVAVQNALRFEEIQRFNVTLQDEVDTATRKLKRQNKRLEELDDIKDDFISMASHQLRTPLTSVKGYLSMVLEGDAGKLTGDQNMMLKQAFASSQRMVFLITDLLNVSRLKTGKFVIDAQPTNLKNIVQQELGQLQETLAAKKLELVYKAPKTLPELMLDEVKIRQVIMNFVDNAIYYTPSGGRLRVELSETPLNVEFRVVDNGIGVPRGEQQHLFTKFYRATNARTARPDGTGLGLFMAQKVIVAQGGSIIFQSREGQGSTFGFSFSKSRLGVSKHPAETKAAVPVHGN